MIKTLRELYNSPGFESFIGDKLGNDLFINDPERADRIHEAAEDGADGSTHSETIEDWREYVELYFYFELKAPDFTSDEEEEKWTSDMENTRIAILSEIDACEAWHETNGSLDKTP